MHRVTERFAKTVFSTNRRRTAKALFAGGLSLIAAVPSAWAGKAPPSPGQQCDQAILTAEKASTIPDRLLAAIGRVESGRTDPVGGGVHPWPWSINAAGRDMVFATKPEAIDTVRQLQAQGTASIDVGCMQVNLLQHPDAFASLEEAFDPVRNAAYAAKFLLRLRAEANDWMVAAAHYHSRTPELAAPYSRKVMAEWTGVPATGVLAAPAPGQPGSILLLPAPMLLGSLAAKPLGIAWGNQNTPLTMGSYRVAMNTKQISRPAASDVPPAKTRQTITCGRSWCLGSSNITMVTTR